jgi:hypothetical protein
MEPVEPAEGWSSYLAKTAARTAAAGTSKAYSAMTKENFESVGSGLGTAAMYGKTLAGYGIKGAGYAIGGAYNLGNGAYETYRGQQRTAKLDANAQQRRDKIAARKSAATSPKPVAKKPIQKPSSKTPSPSPKHGYNLRAR